MAIFLNNLVQFSITEKAFTIPRDLVVRSLINKDDKIQDNGVVYSLW